MKTLTKTTISDTYLIEDIEKYPEQSIEIKSLNGNVVDIEYKTVTEYCSFHLSLPEENELNIFVELLKQY